MTPALNVTYYALVSTGASAQVMGQFVPAVPDWGLPPLTGATQSLRIIEVGSLVLDISSPSEGRVVWRGVAEAEIKHEGNEADRENRLRQAVHDLLRRFPRS